MATVVVVANVIVDMLACFFCMYLQMTMLNPKIIYHCLSGNVINNGNFV